MPLVRRLTLACGPDGVEPVGTIINVDRHQAEYLVKHGMAEYVDGDAVVSPPSEQDQQTVSDPQAEAPPEPLATEPQLDDGIDETPKRRRRRKA